VASTHEPSSAPESARAERLARFRELYRAVAPQWKVERPGASS
jgi:hypothetical protein